jgi:ATP-binding cassette subfamily A (ABC1) protein 3
VTNENLVGMLKSLSSQESISKQISEKGTGNYLFAKLKQQGYISIISLVEFITLEEKGRVIQDFIENRLGNTEIIEHFQAFFRFRLKAKTPIGKIFKEFQENKVKLEIQQYSIKQATV